MPVATRRSCWADCNEGASHRERCRLPFLLRAVSYLPCRMEYRQRSEIPFRLHRVCETMNAMLFGVLPVLPTYSRCRWLRLREQTKIRRMTRVRYIKMSNPDEHRPRRRRGRV